MMVDFDFNKYCDAMKKSAIYARPYIVIDGKDSYLSEDAPESAREAYKNALYWIKKKKEWERVTGERFV